MEPHIKNSKPVRFSDQIRFRCRRCGACCRHVKGSVILECVDAYRLAKHMGIRVDQVYEKYTDPFLLDDSGYPIFALKVKGRQDECVFLDGCRCTIRPARPRVCQLYPFWVEPMDGNGGIAYHYCTECRYHSRGTLIRVKDWMNENLTEEDRMYWAEEYRTLASLAPMLREAKRRGVPVDRIQRELLFFRYYCYETDRPFMEQFRSNNRLLLVRMNRLLKQGGEPI